MGIKWTCVCQLKHIMATTFTVYCSTWRSPLFLVFSIGVIWLHTVAGPMIVTPFSLAILIILLVWASGMPSAMMAIVWIWKHNKIRQLTFMAESHMFMQWCMHVCILQYVFSTCGYCMDSNVLSKAERSEAKLIRTSTSGCFFMASAMFL